MNVHHQLFLKALLLFQQFSHQIFVFPRHSLTLFFQNIIQQILGVIRNFAQVVKDTAVRPEINLIFRGAD